jgi:uncharacterized alkaline shock family protein YloU
VPERPAPGRAVVTRRAVTDIVRTAVLGCYGVAGFATPNPWDRIVRRLGLGEPGIRVDLVDLGVELRLRVAYGLPIAEVARQVDSAVRYAVRRALGREIDRLAIHVDGLRIAPYDVELIRGGRRRQPSDVSPDDLAASGTDVA